MKKILIASFLLLITADSFSQVRKTILFTSDWRFALDSVHEYSKLGNNVASWRKLNLPHDWSIELPFDKESPTGTGGGALRGGMGWYTKEFSLAEKDKNKHIAISFDGVYCNSEVWINGHYLGKRPNGYISFHYDISDYVQYGAAKNIVVVKVDNSKQPNSRWYSGSGIYRNVWLTVTDKLHIIYNGTSVTTPEINTGNAIVKLELMADGLANAKNTFATTVIYNQQGKVVAQEKKILADNTGGVFQQQFSVNNPILWSVENPYLYKAVTQLYGNGKLVDDYTTTFGIRSFLFDADKGFYLNGTPIKIRGVCNHHDLGCFGTAVNYRATERQLEILKAMGCNAIRTSHNPPSPELLTLCDKMGFLVMDEAFDMWEKPKNSFDYHLAFNEWYKRDLQDQVRRDRNHPSVIMWSLGNEIYEQWAKEDDNRPYEILKALYQSVRELDTTRPTVTANNFTDSWNRLIKADLTEMIGYNYHHEEWNDVFKKWKKKPFIITESVSALQTRGHYDMPSDSIRRWPIKWDIPLTTGNADTTCSAYENCSAPWGSTHEETLKIFEKSPHISGMFVWTGFDYIGEPTPYPWPAKSSYFGIVDLAGFPKDCYYLYQSLWTNKTVLHVFPHWNWKQNETIDVWVYYNNADEVELFLNDQSQGVKKKTGDDLHIQWRLSYKPGTIKVISRKNNKIVSIKEVLTAGAPYQIRMLPDRKIIHADGQDVSFMRVEVVDKEGNLVPDASNQISFEVTGNGFVAGVDNGSQTSLESFKGTKRKAFNGLCMAAIQANKKPGSIKIKATSPGLKIAEVVIVSK